MMIRCCLRAAMVCLVVLALSPPVIAEDASTESSDFLLQPDDEFWQEPAPTVFRARFTTGEGDFVVEVQRSWAPIGADRFYNLVRAGFFDDSRFSRVRADYIAQFGIPGEPRVSAVWRDRAIIDDPVRDSNTRGTFAYAMTGPDTRTTQIYINLADNTHLDAEGFAPLGRVIEGVEIVDRLFSGYDEGAGGGMRGGKQGTIFSEGNAHLDREFPSLAKIVRVTLK